MLTVTILTRAFDKENDLLHGLQDEETTSNIVDFDMLSAKFSQNQTYFLLLQVSGYVFWKLSNDTL